MMHKQTVSWPVVPMTIKETTTPEFTTSHESLGRWTFFCRMSGVCRMFSISRRFRRLWIPLSWSTSVISGKGITGPCTYVSTACLRNRSTEAHMVYVSVEHAAISEGYPKSLWSKNLRDRSWLPWWTSRQVPDPHLTVVLACDDHGLQLLPPDPISYVRE